MTIWTIVGLCFVTLVAYRFIKQLGVGLPILELMLLIAGLQWIVGPLIEYLSPNLHYKYYMYVPEPIYMGYVVPAYAVFVTISFLVLRNAKNWNISIENLKHFKKYGLTIFLIGVFFDLISSRLPGALGFFAYIMANFKFAGAIILFYSEDPKLKKIFYFSLLYLFYSALRNAMFHDLVLWSVFFYMFWAIKYKPSLKQIFVTILIGLFSLSTLQTIKSAYRSQVWSGYGGNKLELFAALFVDAVFYSSSNAEELSGEENNVRLNQGWIISAIMNEIPGKVAFLEGETIKEAVFASLLPRFLNPNKKQAGGQENFKRFTGLQLGENTSMGISIIGEAYGNYKVFGGILFMGIWGFFVARFWVYLYRKTQKNLLLLAFLPIIFLQVVKAETELVVVLNHLIKASIVVFLFFIAAKWFLNWNFTRD